MLSTTTTLKKIFKFNAKIDDEITQEELMDDFLDKVNVYRAHLVNITQLIEILTSLFESISRVNEFTTDDRVLIKFAMEMCTDLSKKLSKSYAEGNRLCKPHGIVKTELAENKMAISDLKETISDMHMAFFVLPEDKEFQKLNNELASLL